MADSFGNPGGRVSVDADGDVSFPAEAVRGGLAHVVFPNNNDGSVTVHHGLGKIPAAITLGATDRSFIPTVYEVTDTTFRIVGRVGNIINASYPVYWIAVG